MLWSRRSFSALTWVRPVVLAGAEQLGVQGADAENGLIAAAGGEKTQLDAGLPKSDEDEAQHLRWVEEAEEHKIRDHIAVEVVEQIVQPVGHQDGGGQGRAPAAQGGPGKAAAALDQGDEEGGGQQHRRGAHRRPVDRAVGIVVKGIAGAEAVGQVVKIVGEVQGGGPAPPEEQGQKPPQSGMGWLLPDAQRRIKGQEGHPHVGNDIGIPAEQLQPGKLLKDQVLILPQEHQPQHQRYHPRQAPAGGAVEDAPADAGTPIEDERAVQGGGGVNEGKNCRQQMKHAPPQHCRHPEEDDLLPGGPGDVQHGRASPPQQDLNTNIPQTSSAGNRGAGQLGENPPVRWMTGAGGHGMLFL